MDRRMLERDTYLLDGLLDDKYQPQPRIGEEIAAARALSDLTHQLLDKAAGEISEVTHRPATITA
jgi:hypothetical protein